jgi:hypothetical protein
MEVTRRRGRRCKKLLVDLKNRRGYSHLKEEALDRTVWRNHFGGGFERVVRQNTEWWNEKKSSDYDFQIWWVKGRYSLQDGHIRGVYYMKMRKHDVSSELVQVC